MKTKLIYLTYLAIYFYN